MKGSSLEHTLKLVMCPLNSYTLVAPSLASGEARRWSIPPGRAVTEEQRSQKPNWAQPEGRHVFLAHTSLFAPYRSLRICSSLTPRLAKKSLAAHVSIIKCHSTSPFAFYKFPASGTSAPALGFIGAKRRTLDGVSKSCHLPDSWTYFS